MSRVFYPQLDGIILQDDEDDNTAINTIYDILEDAGFEFERCERPEGE